MPAPFGSYQHLGSRRFDHALEARRLEAHLTVALEAICDELLDQLQPESGPSRLVNVPARSLAPDKAYLVATALNRDIDMRGWGGSPPILSGIGRKLIE